jgi:hypothetical protein
MRPEIKAWIVEHQNKAAALHIRARELQAMGRLGAARMNQAIAAIEARAARQLSGIE